MQGTLCLFTMKGLIVYLLVHIGYQAVFEK